MGHNTPASYRCRRNAPILRLLGCDQAAANAAINHAVRGFLEGQTVLHAPLQTCYYSTTHIGTGAVSAFFKALIAQWLVDHGDVPFPVSEEALALAQGARAESYFTLLEKCWRTVVTLCTQWGESALPMSVGCAIGIITKMACSEYSLGYIQDVECAIAFAHRYSGLPIPTKDERFEVFYDCVARRLGHACPNAKDALMLDDLRKIGELIYAGTSSHEIQDWAIVTLTFFSVFRRKNVCELQNRDVQPLGDGVRILLRKSKNDQYGYGHEVFIDPLPDEQALCPVRAILRHKAQLPGPDGPFFRHLGPLGTITDEPLDDKSITTITKRLVERIGLDPARYSAQSLRAGLITAAILAHVPLPALAGHTGHSEIASLARYFRPGNHRIAIVRTIATATPPSFAKSIVGG